MLHDSILFHYIILSDLSLQEQVAPGEELVKEVAAKMKFNLVMLGFLSGLIGQ